ncbi:TPA: hypothetical protein VBX77_004081 [Yersinia enterocolitica]|nr:hypothetical protein [Yersinia enterocolitica]
MSYYYKKQIKKEAEDEGQTALRFFIAPNNFER